MSLKQMFAPDSPAESQPAPGPERRAVPRRPSNEPAATWELDRDDRFSLGRLRNCSSQGFLLVVGHHIPVHSRLRVVIPGRLMFATVVHSSPDGTSYRVGAKLEAIVACDTSRELLGPHPEAPPI